MVMSSLEIIRNIIPQVAQSSKAVAVDELSIKKGRRKGMLIIYTKTLIPKEKRQELKKRYNTHKVLLYPADSRYNGKLKDCPAIKVSCDCENHMYTWEYALHNRGAADILKSNGEPPNETNPYLKPGCCKHVLKTLIYIHKNNL